MTQKKVYQLNLCGGWLRTNLDPKHELIILSEQIDWEALTDQLSRFYSKTGRQSKTVRMMVGLHILKHRFNMSDESVVERLRENLYFRFFCGLDGDLEDWNAQKPLEASTMTNFRKRLGAEGMQIIENIITGTLLKKKDRLPKSPNRRHNSYGKECCPSD